jgi:hypothetical protein
MGDACSPFRFVWDQRSRFSISLSDFSFGHLRTTARLRYVCYGCQLESGIFRQWPNEKSEREMENLPARIINTGPVKWLIQGPFHLSTQRCLQTMTNEKFEMKNGKSSVTSRIIHP